MEIDGTRDGVVSFTEFLAWYTGESATKTAGSMAFKLQKAKEAAFVTEEGKQNFLKKMMAAEDEDRPSKATTPEPERATPGLVSKPESTGGSIAPKGRGLSNELEIWRGSGVESLISKLDDTRVMFALMRFALGSGSFACVGIRTPSACSTCDGDGDETGHVAFACCAAGGASLYSSTSLASLFQSLSVADTIRRKIQS